MKITYNSPVILTFALVSSVVLLLNGLLGGQLMNYFAIGPSLQTTPAGPLGLISHVLGHGNVEHLLGNMTFILLIGPIIEEKYGSIKTLLMIVFTALITGLINVAFFPSGLLGASGIVFMLILLVSFTNVKQGKIPLTFILVAILFIGKEVVQSLQADHVSQSAHIIGGVCGSIFGFILGKPKASSGSLTS